MIKKHQFIILLGSMILCTFFISCIKDKHEEPQIINPEKKLKAGFISIVNPLHNTKTVRLYNVSQKANSIKWIFGDGNSSTLEIDEYTYSNPGTYIIKLEASNGTSTDVFSDTIVINQELSHSYYFANNQAKIIDTCGCIPLNAYFEFNNNSTWLNYLWTFGDNSSSTNFSNNQNSSHVYENFGDYNIELRLNNNDTAITYYFPSIIHTYQTPDAAFFASPEVTSILHSEVEFTNISTLSTSYFWSFGDGYISTERNPVHTYTEVGEFWVKLIVVTNFGCYDIATNKIVIKADQR